MNKKERIELIKQDLKASNKVLNALSDENRQKILLVLLDNCVDGGIRVDDIAKEINLSRPAVSHHIKILKDENIVSCESIGTKNYYHITGINEILSLKKLLNDIELFVNERNEEEWKIWLFTILMRETLKNL